ncbi:MAG: hypothetical protein ACFFE2_04915 [Candidatus Thorarchaeota archaeon]
MDAVANHMKGYFTDKQAHPWHSMYKDIEKYWLKEHPKRDVTESLILLRDAVFSSLEILSLSIALDVPTSELVAIFTKEATWKEGRQKVRNKSIELIEEMINKRKTRYIVPSALKRDGFGFLVGELEEAELETFKKARPKMKKVKEKKSKKSRGKQKMKEVLDLGPLEKSKLGSRFLREQMIMESQIDKDDPRIPTLIEAYEQFLVNIEIDLSASIPEPVPTEQVTLNGKPLAEEPEVKSEPSKRTQKKGVQSPLTDFIEEKPVTKKKAKKRRTKKK